MTKTAPADKTAGKYDDAYEYPADIPESDGRVFIGWMIIIVVLIPVLFCFYFYPSSLSDFFDFFGALWLVIFLGGICLVAGQFSVPVGHAFVALEDGAYAGTINRYGNYWRNPLLTLLEKATNPAYRTCGGIIWAEHGGLMVPLGLQKTFCNSTAFDGQNAEMRMGALVTWHIESPRKAVETPDLLRYVNTSLEAVMDEAMGEISTSDYDDLRNMRSHLSERINDLLNQELADAGCAVDSVRVTRAAFVK